VLLTQAAVDKPWQPFEDNDDRRLMEHCCMKEAKPPWNLGPPPQDTARAVRVPVSFTRLLCALALAYRRPCEREAMGGEPVGGHRWQRPRLEPTREQGIVCAQGHDGLFHLATYARLLGVKLKDVPPAIGSRQQVLATDNLPAQG
jgi:hypothetical protein